MILTNYYCNKKNSYQIFLSNDDDHDASPVIHIQGGKRVEWWRKDGMAGSSRNSGPSISESAVHLLQGRHISSLGQQLNADSRLSFPFCPKKNDKAGLQC